MVRQEGAPVTTTDQVTVDEGVVLFIEDNGQFFRAVAEVNSVSRRSSNV